MKVEAFEGVVDDGAIQLVSDVRLPDKTRVFVVVPEEEGPSRARVLSPRLAHPEQASDFSKVVLETPPDAEL